MNAPLEFADPVAHLDRQVLVDFLGKTRWFGGKGRPFAVSDVRRIGTLAQSPDGAASPPHVVVLLVELTYHDVPASDPDAVEIYQVPLALYTEAEHRLDHAFVGWWEEPGRGWVHAYDALHDRQAMALWLVAFGRAEPDGDPGSEAARADVGDLRFHRMPGHDLDLEAVSSLFTGEQSNSSVAYGEDAVLKVFRKITPGANPDITTHEALTRAGSTHVAHLYGWVEYSRTEAAGGESDGGAGDLLHLGMLQQFLRTASDGWDLALSSVRNLFADDDLAARDAGGDFAGESARLGTTLREIHEVLREHFDQDHTTGSRIADTMRSRLRTAVESAPDLASYEAGLLALYDRVAEVDRVPVQRVHGDLHLGQTLRTALGWKLVDFEGEPARPLAERMLPDSAWRDVAGMLRSFDYAPHVVERQHTELGPEGAEDRAARGRQWTERNQRYFLDAYAEELTPEQRLLLDAFVADKAVYETLYETRNRPTWVDIPLAAVDAILQEEGT